MIDQPRTAAEAVAALLAKRDTSTGKPYIGKSTLKRAAAIVRAVHEAEAAAQPSGALRIAIANAINAAPGMHVAEYGASMVGRQHAIDVAVEAVRTALAAGEQG